MCAINEIHGQVLRWCTHKDKNYGLIVACSVAIMEMFESLDDEHRADAEQEFENICLDVMDGIDFRKHSPQPKIDLPAPMTFPSLDKTAIQVDESRSDALAHIVMTLYLLGPDLGFATLQRVTDGDTELSPSASDSDLVEKPSRRGISKSNRRRISKSNPGLIEFEVPAEAFWLNSRGCSRVVNFDASLFLRNAPLTVLAKAIYNRWISKSYSASLLEFSREGNDQLDQLIAYALSQHSRGAKGEICAMLHDVPAIAWLRKHRPETMPLLDDWSACEEAMHTDGDQPAASSPL